MFARRAGLIKTVPVAPSTPLGDATEALATPTPGSTTGNRAADAIHPIDDAPLKARRHSQVGKKVSRKRKQRGKEVQKSRHNARPWNKLPKKTLKKARRRRKTSKTVSTRAASLPKTLRRGEAAKKALKRSVSKHGRKQARRAARVRARNARR